MFKKIMNKLLEKRDLSEQEAAGVMTEIMDGRATQAQIAGFLTALRFKGETVNEITGCAKVMISRAEGIRPDAGFCIDTCGTGGDGSNTFNISTAASIVAAAAGVSVAKHGNRSVSSKCGSADILEALGVNIQLSPYQVKECIETTGIGFLFAPSFHRSMKHAAAPRKELGIRTIFNVLGPLTNPAGAQGQLLGVFSAELVSPIAYVLKNLGTRRAMVVHGKDGLDEVTTADATIIAEFDGNSVREYEITPEEFNIHRAQSSDLKGGDAAQNAEIILSVFRGEKGPKRDIVVLNAAAAIYVGGIADSLIDCVEIACDMLDTGKALGKLKELRKFTQSF